MALAPSLPAQPSVKAIDNVVDVATLWNCPLVYALRTAHMNSFILFCSQDTKEFVLQYDQLEERKTLPQQS
jgi:hypothetical protein